MPVSFNSPPRNFFLLGSSGEDIITNFFNNIDQSGGTDGLFHPDEIRYNYSDQKYILAGSAEDSNSKGFGWFEKRDYGGTSAPKDWDVRVESTTAGVNTTLRALELDSADNLIVVGKTGTVPWIAKYDNDGILDWQSTTNSADVEYTGITSDVNGNYYACGSTPTSGSAQAFVENFGANGTPGWGKEAFMLGRDVILNKIAVNSRGHVVSVGHLEDDNSTKGYIVKIDTTTGEVLWDRTLESFEIFSASTYKPVLCESVFIDNKDQIYVVGRVFDISDTRGFIIKYSPEGNIIWQKETPDNEHFEYYDVKSDGDVEQTIVLGRYLDGSNGNASGVLTKYSKNGDIVFRRLLSSSYNSGANFGRTGLGGAVNLDADPSFYYLLFVDDAFSGLNGTPESYTFGKVSTSGNGFGNFQYDDGGGETIDYDLSVIGDRIGKLSDGSVRNDTSDLTTYPFGANQILFDDLSTQISNKRRQMDGPDSFEYSGSPAIRPADFQELNLLGDVYSGSGNWLDQSGNGNDAVTSFTTTTTLPGTTESENFASTTSSYSTYGTVAENTVTNDLPYNNADWSHYGGKVRDLQTGGFRIDVTGNSNANAFFMGCWIKFDTYATSRQMGIDLSGGYVYWETLANGAIAVRHNGGSRADSAATSLNDGNWHHIALSRIGTTLYGFLDGTAVISTTSGVGGASVSGNNENFWFFGGSGTSYNVDAKVLDPFVYLGSGVSSYTVPTAPLIDSDGNINHFSGFSGQEGYISPAISLPGGTTTTTNGPTHNDSGYWEFDGTNDRIDLGTTPLLESNADFSIESWVWVDALTSECSICEIQSSDIVTTTTTSTTTTNTSTTIGWVAPGTPCPAGQWKCEVNGNHPNGGLGDRCCQIVTTTTTTNTDTNSMILLSAGSTTDGNVGGRFVVRKPTGQDLGVRDSTGYIGSGLNEWHHYVGVFTGGANYATTTLYVDGEAKLAADIIDAPWPFDINNCSVQQLGLSSGDRYFDGRMGEVRIYQKALTAAQVFQNYNATKSKYINEAPDTAPKIGPGIVYDSNLLLNYDFGNRATYDRVENLFRYGNDLKNWTALGSPPGIITRNLDIISPHGTTDVVKCSSSGSSVGYFQPYGTTYTYEADKTYTVSGHFKADDTNEVVMLWYDGANNFWVGNDGSNNIAVFFNLDDGTTSISGGGRAPTVDYGMTNLGGGWWRCWMTETCATTHTSKHQPIRIPTFKNVGVYAWGLQLNEGGIGRYVSSYNNLITAPTTVKNLSSSSYPSTISGAEFNSAGYFVFDNANNDEIITSQTTVADTGMPGLTVEVWANLSSSTVFGSGGRAWMIGEEGRWRMTYDDAFTDGAFYFACATTNNGWFTSGTSIFNYAPSYMFNNWHHFVGVYDGSNLRMYYDGGTGNVNATTISGNVLSSGDPVLSIMGTDAANVGWGTGSIGQVRIYNRGLTATEVSQNFNATRSKYGV